MKVRRGDIFMADLSTDNVDFICGIRPVIIVQNNKGNIYSNTYIAAIITSKPKKFLPTHVLLDKRCGLRWNSTVLCEHLVTVKDYMLTKHISNISRTEDMKKINEALSISIGTHQSGKKA